MKYLAHRALSANWRGKFEQASKRYLENSSDCQLYGFLVRDVGPHRNDLASPVSALGIGKPESTFIELVALYLPPERLDGIGEELIARRAGAAR